MLHRLEIENFYSIRDPQVIDLRARASVDACGDHLAPLWPGAVERAPKVVALFGANASGKSNVLRALAFLSWFIKGSFAAPRGAKLPFERFADPEMQSAPMRIAVHFSGPEEIDAPNGRYCEYVYQITLGGPGPAIVMDEILYKLFQRPARKSKIFERKNFKDISAHRSFGLGAHKRPLEKVLRPDVSAIATLAQLDHPYSKELFNYASAINYNILVHRTEDSNEDVARFYAQAPKFVEFFNETAQRIDLGVKSMAMQPGPQGPVAWFEHHGLGMPLALDLQSHGTQQFLKLYPILFAALDRGGIAVMDELDAAIHPMILPEIVRWFHDPGRNPHNAQLWMTCHNASLLEDLHKEEILFCDKNAQGRTEVYGLSDIQGIRRSDNYYKKYLGGAFGAVPHIG